MEWLRDTSIFHPGDFPGWMGYIIGPLSSPKWPIWELEGISPQMSNCTNCLCFFPDILGLSEWLYNCWFCVWRFGFLGIYGQAKPLADCWFMTNTISKHLWDAATSHEVLQYPTLKGEGFKSATNCWRKKPTQETDRKTHWDQPSTKRNLDFSLTKWRFPCS